MIGAASAALAAALASTSALPPDQDYITVVNGQLHTAGKRIRLWCAIGGYPNFSGIEPADPPDVRTAKRDRAYADARAILDRFTLLGFNGMRMWEKPTGSYMKGDGSRSDVLDYFVAEAKKRGFRIWLPSVSTPPISADGAGLAGNPAEADAWRSAVNEKNGSTWIARVWDERLESAQVKHMEALTNHVNQHTGLRWGDDPIFGIWELTNEEWWMMKMVGGQWQTLPEFFRRSLSRKWHSHLVRKYKTEAGLKEAWGFLMPGESLAGGTVQIAPLAGAVQQDTSGMDPQARRQVEESRAAGRSTWTRDSFVRARGADVLEFFVDLQISHKLRLRDALKGMGKSPRLGPVAFDTGIGYEIQSQYMHQQADAVVHDAYINGFTTSPLQQRKPFYSGLEEWPRIAQDVPWLEHNRVAGKPYLCYETQIMQPAKYRAEYPMRLLALAAIQDWDAICWHYWGSVPDITTNPKPFDKAMDNTTGWHPQGYHYTYDEVQNALMRAAAFAFRNGHLAPAPSPTLFTYGRSSLYDPASMDYGGSYGKIGQRMLPTTYAHGVRIWIDPNQEGDKVSGPTVDPLGQALPNFVQPTRQIRFDVDKGGLTLDSPGAVGFTGFKGRFGNRIRFQSGLSLSGVELNIPKGMPYSDGLATEKYIGFLLAAEDGLPLTMTRKATLALKSTSFNSGLEMLFRPDSLAKGGDLPVLEARVSGVVQGPALAGMSWRMLDWHGVEIGRGQVGRDGRLAIPSDKPIWVMELTR